MKLVDKCLIFIYIITKVKISVGGYAEGIVGVYYISIDLYKKC